MADTKILQLSVGELNGNCIGGYAAIFLYNYSTEKTVIHALGKIEKLVMMKNKTKIMTDKETITLNHFHYIEVTIGR